MFQNLRLWDGADDPVRVVKLVSGTGLLSVEDP